MDRTWSASRGSEAVDGGAEQADGLRDDADGDPFEKRGEATLREERRQEERALARGVRQDPLRERVGFALLAAGSDEPASLIEVSSAGLALELARRLDVVTVAPESLAVAAVSRGDLVAVNTPYRLPPLPVGVMRHLRRELRAGSHRLLSLLLRSLRRRRAQERSDAG